MIEQFKNLYRYRDMIWNLVVRDLKVKYKGSALGFLWSFLNPLILMGLYWIIFTKLAPDMKREIPALNGKEINYGIFLISSMWPWMAFQGAVAKSAPTFILNDSLIKKVYFPREVLPIATVLSEFVNFLFGIAIFYLILLITGYQPSVSIIWFPVMLWVLFSFTMGCALLISVIDVFFRDAEQILNSFLTILFFATPIIYSVELVRQKLLGTYEGLSDFLIMRNQMLSKLYFSNPLAWIIPYTRYSLLGGMEMIKGNVVLVMFVLSTLFLVFAYWRFKAIEHRIVEEV
ncbi:MAG: ABC transporter permease [bacterium]|nr:ABC transporter permease [bacterium]